MPRETGGGPSREQRNAERKQKHLGEELKALQEAGNGLLGGLAKGFASSELLPTLQEMGTVQEQAEAVQKLGDGLLGGLSRGLMDKRIVKQLGEQTNFWGYPKKPSGGGSGGGGESGGEAGHDGGGHDGGSDGGGDGGGGGE